LASERDPSSSAVEEAHSEFVFQCFDLKCHGRLGKEKMFRGLAKVQMLRDSTKHLEAKVFQLGQVMIIPRKGETREPIVVQAESLVKPEVVSAFPGSVPTNALY
jgi:hypothetical protein